MPLLPGDDRALDTEDTSTREALKTVTNLAGRQIARNRETLNQPSFASHREHVMRLIAEAIGEVVRRQSESRQRNELPTITIIGAGNCQDIDLSALAGAFREIRLVDIDVVAVNTAVAQFTPDVRSGVRVLAPIDIAAPLMSLPGPSAERCSTQPDPAFLTAVESASLPEEIPVSDIVVSTCLLSQLIDSASECVPPELPEFLPLVQAVRRGHLARLLSITATAGQALLITDLVSSDTVPELIHTPLSEMPKLMSRCLQTGNFFSGLNPAVIQHDLQHLPACVQLCASSRIRPPWSWQLGPRSFAVYAVEMVRR